MGYQKLFECPYCGDDGVLADGADTANCASCRRVCHIDYDADYDDGWFDCTTVHRTEDV